MWHIAAIEEWHLDIDNILRFFIPRNYTHLLPSPISRFLGYRDGRQKPIGNVFIAVWALVGAFVGVVVLEALFMAPEIRRHSPPPVIASFGAAAILQYNAIDSPLAQPRHSVFGHLLSAIMAVSVTKLFKLNPDFEKLRWISGGMSCGTASAAMTLTNSVYPPAGATALLASVDPEVERLGWYLVLLVLLSSVVMLLLSLLLNNVHRRYPTYWWTPEDLYTTKVKGDVEKNMAAASRVSEGSS